MYELGILDEFLVLLNLLQEFPSLRRIPARMLGLGFRPAHVRTPDATSESAR
jgi:hypothetical protein